MLPLSSTTMDKTSLDKKSPPSLTPLALTLPHTGQNFSPRPLKDKTSHHSSTSVETHLPHLPQLQLLLRKPPSKNLRRMLSKERRKSHHHQKKKKKKEEWEACLIELFKLYLTGNSFCENSLFLTSTRFAYTSNRLTKYKVRPSNIN